MSLGDNIKEYRKKANITQDDLAKKIGVSKSFISKIEINNKVPSFEVLLKIAKVLNVLVTDLNPKLKKDNYTNVFSSPGLYVVDKSRGVHENILETLEEGTHFTEDEIIRMLIDCYNDDVFNKKYDTEKITENQVEELKPIIRGIVEIALKNCDKNK